jgi:uncharacterized protein YndB with AHSA1/START domain
MQQEKIISTDKTLHISKELNAPIAWVWQVWTSIEHIKNWWGPNGFTNTIRKMDMQPGGEWLFTMHGPDGKNYPNKSIFKEIIPQKKIVFEHFNPGFITTIEFVDKDETTLLSWKMVFETAELFDAVVKTFKADEGLKQNIIKLEQYVIEQLKIN